MSLRTAAAVVLSGIALVACDFTSFDAYRSNTPVLTISAPNGYPDLNFATNLAVASNDMDIDWLLASGGLGTAVAAVGLRNGTHIGTDSPASRYVCSSEDSNLMCGGTTRFGTALAGIASWSGATACAITGAFGTVDEVHIGCLGSDPPTTFDITPPAGFEMSGFGLAIAAPRRRSATEPTPADIIFVGALAGPGTVFAVQPIGVTNVTPGGLTSMTGAMLGSAVAVGKIATGGMSDLLLLAGAPAIGAVQVLRGDPRAGRAMQPIGCILRSGEPGFGGVLATGDIDGDGSDDVIVGSSAGSDRMQRVHVFLTSMAPSTLTCDGTSWPETVMPFTCTDPSDHSVECQNNAAGFGTSIAAGDLDGDGRDEIVVGAPSSTVDGQLRAGAVFVYTASGSPGGAVTLTQASILRDSVATTDVDLGGTVVVARLGERDELIASAVGDVAARVYLCTGIPGDRPGGSLGVDCR